MNSINPRLRIGELDALRGIAAVAVLLFHFTSGIAKNWTFHLYDPPFQFPYGGAGVDLFFMISGFVIFMTLDRAKSAASFAVGRFSRLYPTLWACAVITLLVTANFGLPGMEVNSGEALWNLTMLPRFVRARMIDGVYWSLEYELLFYVAMLILHLLGAFKKHTVPVLLLWLAAAAAAHGILTHLNAESLVYRLTGKIKAVTSLDYIHLFGVGMILYDSHRRRAWSAGHSLVLLVCGAIAWWKAESQLHFALVLAFGLLLHLATTGRLPFLNAKVLVFLGAISYPLYLIHQNIGLILLNALGAVTTSAWMRLGVTVVAMVLLAWVISVCIERPSMKWVREKMKRLTERGPPSPQHSADA
ncbi:acyltransferase family protein [Prosthecobacter sp.]|uniref:acyltransferase family protein n=1 Tax=Prosthecobacter sp. TaxID=1965333 RepID=UPI0037847953